MINATIPLISTLEKFTWILKTLGHWVMVPHVKAQLRTSKGLTFGRDINLARQGLFFHVVSTVQHMAVVGRAIVAILQMWCRWATNHVQWQWPCQCGHCSARGLSCSQNSWNRCQIHSQFWQVRKGCSVQVVHPQRFCPEVACLLSKLEARAAEWFAVAFPDLNQ